MAKAKSTEQVVASTVTATASKPKPDAKKFTPIERVRNVLIPLYLSDPIDGWRSLDKLAALPPLAALVLATMAIEQVSKIGDIEFRLWNFNELDKREAPIATEVGIVQLMSLKYVRPASKVDALAIESRDHGVWSMPRDARLVITAAGAKRIAALAGSMLGVPLQELAKSLPIDSKAWAKKHPAPVK